MLPETRYALAGDVHIAYQVLGTGPVDVVLADQWFSHMEAQWDVPPLAELRRRLGAFSRLILFDKRGIGLSDPVPIKEMPMIEEWIDDVRAVLDAVDSRQAALVTNIGGAIPSLVCAAALPDRLSALVIVDGFARFTAAPDYPIGASEDEKEAALAMIDAGHGRALMIDVFAPSVAGDARLRGLFGRYERQSASPGSATAMVRLLYETDVRDVLPTIRVPTLVMHHAGAEHLPPALGRYIADHVPGARFVELPGADSLMWAGDQELMVAEIQEFVTGVRPRPEPTRVLATVLFTDIVDSTARAAELGDRRWGQLLTEHDRVVRDELARAAGREIKTTGDGFLATFDGPARAVRAALAIRDALREIGVTIRAGLHTGEIEILADDVAGVGVHIGSRVAALAGPGEILVSSTVKDLVAGSGITFEDRGTHTLKGVPDAWRLHAVLAA
ncbi:MAG: adenylate/guanylate cyclase domain-containing protein [Chloroflexota bacterium]|nr:adenylate/guanylate cyclase domain-containing protein [Chloroflexota bacterium]